MKINKPNVAQVELTRGCNAKCEFCAIHTLPKQREFMSLKTAIKTAKELQVFDPLRIEFSLRGEPTLNPNWIKIVSIFRRTLKESQITLATNGIKLTENDVSDYFRAGGNILIVDAYGKTYNKYMERLKKFNPLNYYETDFNPYHRHKNDVQAVVVIPDISQHNKAKNTRVIVNQAGNVDFKRLAKYGVTPLKEPLTKRCVHPFREINIFYNGNIPICCRDWKEETLLWNIKLGNLKHYWENNKRLNACRYLLFHKNRKFGICKRCDYNGGMRVGLIAKMADYDLNKIKGALKLWRS